MIKKILWIATIWLLSITTANAEKTCDWNYNCYDIDFWDWIYRDDWWLAWTVEDNNFNFAFNYFSWSSVRSNNLERKISYWWQSDWLYYTSRYWNLSSPINWKINWFYVCSERPYMQTAYRTLASANFCTYKDWFSELNTYLKGTDKYTISCNSSTTYANCMVCLIQETQGNYICIDNWNTSNNENEFLEITQIETIATRNPFSNNWWWNNTQQRNSNSICPTMGQILNNYPTAYNTWLCYNSTLRYNNGQIETVEQKTIQETFENYNELQERWNIYNNNCRVPYTQEQCQWAFSWQRNKYSIISNAFNGNTESKRLRNYCNIYLNYDLNMSSCVASWYQGEKFTEKEIQDTLLWIDEIRVLTPGTWNILNWLLGSWQTREDINIYDVLGNLDQIKEKITSIFNERHGVDGIIPDYILWLILTTLLLTVLLKK